MSRFLDFVEQVVEAPAINDVWQILMAEMKGFGFDRLLYAFTRFRRGNSFGDPRDILVLSNHSKEFLQEFIDNGLYFHAPMVKWAAENVGACSWGWMQKPPSEFTPEEARLLEFNRRMGIRAGYSISFKDVSSRAKGAIGLVAGPGMSQRDADAVWVEHGRLIVQMNNVAHLKITSLPCDSGRKPLTTRQREVLEWVGEGKTLQEIATIMGVSRSTVEKHLRLAREALDVETSTQAVLKATIQNRIFLVDS